MTPRSWKIVAAVTLALLGVGLLVVALTQHRSWSYAVAACLAGSAALWLDVRRGAGDRDTRPPLG